MSKPYSVSFVGSGNLAWHLATALDNTEFNVHEVFSPTTKNARALVERLYQGDVMESLDFSESTSRIFILAVADDVIEKVSKEIKLPPNAILVHTSGSQPLSALTSASTANIGVFYPLQTFTKGKKVNFADIPIFIESENSETEKILASMAKAISKKVVKISSDDRRALHVAAVFASNFTNHMLTLSKEIMDGYKLKFDLLKPLIAETLNKSLEIGPENSQTGPAKRGDLETLDKHLEFLQADAQIAEIYKVVSQNIIDRYV